MPQTLHNAFIQLLGGMLALAWPLAASAQPHSGDPFDENFFPPDLVMRTAPALGLSEEQQNKLRQAVEGMEQQMRGLEQRMEKERDVLTVLVKQPRLNEAPVLAQVEKMHQLEGEAKQAHVRMLIQIKNLLTPEQQARLQPMKQAMRELEEKMRRLERKQREWEESGRDMWTFQLFHLDFDEAMKRADFKAAEAALDRTLRRLEEAESQ